MAEYKISSSATTEQQGKGTAESPFQLQVSTATTAVTAINLNGCYAKINGNVYESYASKFEKITAFDGGTLTNESACDWFYGARKLSSFTTNCPNLTNGEGMFGNSNITTLDFSLFPKITNCNRFFGDNNKIGKMITTIPTATNVANMFSFCSRLGTVNITLPEATDATKMFNACDNLHSLYMYAPKLTTITDMFYSCSLSRWNDDGEEITFVLITNETIANKPNSDFDSQNNCLDDATKTIEDYEGGLKKITWHWEAWA